MPDARREKNGDPFAPDEARLAAQVATIVASVDTLPKDALIRTFVSSLVRSTPTRTCWQQ
jgi:hypothetical protein